MSGILAATFYNSAAAAPAGDALFTTPGTYSWTAPAGVTSVCVVCVGGGGAGSDAPAPFPTPARNGNAGGSGIVITRFPSGATVAVAPCTNSVATLPAPEGGYKVATFTVSGTLTVS